MMHGLNPSLKNLVEFKLCEAKKWNDSYFNPFAKKPITMCYNKFVSQEKFEQALTYNVLWHKYS